MRRAPALAAAALLVMSACRCGRPRQVGPPERHVPASATLAIVVPALAPAADQLGGLYRTLAAIPAAAELNEAWNGLKAQLGFDPLDRAGLEQAGLDPAGGAAMAFGAGAPLLVLPVADAGRLDAAALRLARDRMGAGLRTTSVVGGHQVVSYRRDPKAPSALAYAIVNGYALLAVGTQGPETTAAAAGQPESLAADASWPQARAALGADYAVLCYARRGSPALPALPLVGEGAALGLRARSSGLGLRTAVLYGAGRAAWFASLAGPSAEAARSAGSAEAARLAPDAALVMRWGGDPVEPGRRLFARLPPRVAAALAAAHVDLERDLLANLKAGAAASVSLAPSFTVAEFSSPRLDPRRLDPFRLVNVELLARVKDAALARAFFARLTEAAPRWKARVASHTAPDGSTSWTLSYGAGHLAWSLAGDRLAVAGGAGRLGPLERRSAAGDGTYRPPTPLSRAALDSGVGGAVLDVERLVSAVRSLPDEAYGTGPNGFVMRSLAERFLEPAARLRAASLRFDLAAGAAVIDLEIEGREGGAGQP